METRIYEPHSNRGWGLEKWREMLRDLWQSREFAWSMFRRNMRAQQRGTLFGNAGLLIEPILLVSPFLVMVLAGVLSPGDIGAPYPVYASLGLAFFYIFREGVTQFGNAMIVNQSIIVKINFPKEVLIFALLGQVIFNFFVRMALVVVFIVYYFVVDGAAISWATLLFPLAIVPMFVLSLGVGLFLAFLTALMRDVAKYVGMLMPFVLFTSPILYSTIRLPVFETVTRYNPIAGLVIGPRDLILYGRLSDPVQYWFSVVVAVVVFLLGWRIFRIAEVRLAERLGAK